MRQHISISSAGPGGAAVLYNASGHFVTMPSARLACEQRFMQFNLKSSVSVSRDRAEMLCLPYPPTCCKCGSCAFGLGYKMPSSHRPGQPNHPVYGQDVAARRLLAVQSQALVIRCHVRLSAIGKQQTSKQMQLLLAALRLRGLLAPDRWPVWHLGLLLGSSEQIDGNGRQVGCPVKCVASSVSTWL